MSRVDININPNVLRWAREEAGYDATEVADKMDIEPDRYKLWEKNGKNIPLAKLKVLANTYKRQLAVFLLPEVPEKLTRPKDFRNLSPSESKLSKKTLEVIRDVTYFRQIALELYGEHYWKNRYQWLETTSGGIKDSVISNQRLREHLNISIEDQMMWRTEGEAYRYWRLAVEERLGIFVFQFSMPINEVQGFCFTDEFPFAIVTNSNHSYTGRIFTIFHELAHILRHHSSMCLFEKATEKQKTEWECNSFAGNFLAPSNFIEQTGDLAEIKQYASKLKISREVYLRRLKEENKISEMKFYKLLNQIRSSYKTDKKKSGFVKPEVKSRASRGETFFNLVVEAMHNNRISYNKASNALGLSLPTLLNEV